MFSHRLFAREEKFLAPIKRYLHHHPISAFRALLFSGDGLLLLLLIFGDHERSPQWAA